MCGINGIAYSSRSGRRVDPSLLARMRDVITHRGPDDEGIFVDGAVGLGHRRLSIVDVKSGHQPMTNEDATLHVTYNGEIYNHADFREQLEARGHVYKTHCDTETILHLYEEHGTACVQHLRGMFAFAIWDQRRRELFIARDRLGVKPLYYAELSDGRLIFGSELKALLLHPLLQRRIDPQAVEEYFAFGYVPDPKTIYRDVKKLEPGAYICMKRGDSHVKPVRYWDVPLDGERALEQPAAAWEEELRARLKEAVRKRLVSDVPLGAFLSGGIDSSAVVAMMREIGAGHILTCSIGFDEPRYDESSYARMVAEAKHTDHKAEIVATSDYSLVDRLVGIYDEPYADSSAIPTYRVCELARRHVTVALSGDGGDENLIGYRRYKLFAMEEQVRSRVPLGLRKAIFGPLGSLYPKLDWAPRVLRGKTTFQALARDAVAAYFHGVSICSNEMRASLFSHEFRRELGGYGAEEVFRQHVRGKTFNDPLKMIQYLDFKTYLPGDILTKVDRASMAHSLEVRTPFLDYELVEWVASLPSAIKLKGGEGKHILKRSLEPLLPREVLYRNKMGFAVPLDVWFRGSLRDHIAETVRGRRLAESGLFNPATLARIVADHQSGRRDHSAILWSLLMFDGFLRQNATPGVVPELVTRLSGAA